jgi:hypothetical protein
MLSYAHLLNDIQNFKRAGTNSGSEFNYFDTKGHKFFKILFYFGQDNNNKDTNSSNKSYFSTGGLLTPTWNKFKDIETFQGIDDNKVVYNVYDNEYNYYSNDLENLHIYNSAWAYLMLNDEKQRAKHLEHFVNLLSNISSESPWYFQSIEGITDALDRKVATDGKFEFGESKKLTIKCIEDAFDNRITTLLDLYRDITWSWTMKREVIPANLRKFDMAIYIFESPVLKWHEEWNDGLNDTINIDSKSGYQPSYKMLEFHNCEIDYNSIKSGISELSNEIGLQPKYSIDIKYDDCYEISYNEFLMERIGDIILSDFNTIQNTKNAVDKLGVETNSKDVEISNTAYFNDVNKNVQQAGLNKRFNPFDKGLIGNAVNQLVSTGVNYVEDKIERVLLGNLHTYSLTRIGSQVKDVLDGNIIKTVQAAKDYIDDSKKRKENAHKTPPTNNISTNNKHDRPVEFDNDITGPNNKLFDDKVSDKEQPSGNIMNSKIQKKEQPSGDLFDNEIPKKEQPNGDLFDNEVPKKEQPSGDLFDNEVPRKEQPNGNILDSELPKKEQPNGNILDSELPKKEQPSGDLFDNEVPRKEQPNGNILDSELPKKEQPNGDLFDNEVPKKEQPIGNIMNSKMPKKEQPIGNITGLSGQQLAALKFKEKPKGKIFDSNI